MLERIAVPNSVYSTAFEEIGEEEDEVSAFKELPMESENNPLEEVIQPKSPLLPVSHDTQNGDLPMSDKMPVVFSQDQLRAIGSGEDGGDDLEVDLIVPDGGFAWWILFASIVVNILIPGTVKSFGILFLEFIEIYKVSPAEASWIPAISFFLYSSTSPFASILSIRFSDRFVTILGGLLAATGLCLSYFSTSVISLCITYGVIGGLGAGLAYPIGVFMVARYFEKRRGLANGLCTSGSALGSVVMPLLLQYLLTTYGYRKAIFICGCLLLNVCVVALLYDPVEKHMKRIKRISGNIPELNGGPITGSSAPIPIPRKGKPMFQIGHDTPRGAESCSPQSIDGFSLSPSAVRLSKMLEESQYSQNQQSYRTKLSTNTSPPPLAISNPDVSVVSSYRSTGNLSKLNLSAIREDATDDEDGCEESNDGVIDWNFYRGLTPAKQRLIGLSTQGQTPPLPTSQLHSQRNLSQLFSVGGDTERGGGVCRTLSMISNASTSSFHYISTIHHGSLLTSIQFDENVNQIPPTISTQTITQKVKRDSSSAADEVDQLPAEPPKSPSIKRKRKLFDFSLFSSPFFIIFLLSSATTAVSYTNFIILLPTYALQKGFHKSEASYLLSVVAALDFVGRIGGAALSDLKLISRDWFFVVGLFFSGLTLTFFSLAHDLTTFAIFCGCFGFFSGTYIGVTAVILADKLGPQRLGSSFSISLFLNGVLQLGGPPICGLLAQELETNEPILICLGIFLMVGASIWILVPFLPNEHIPLQPPIITKKNKRLP